MPVEPSARGSLQDPLFILGQARSGSSILYRLIQSHPSFEPIKGPNLSESFMMDVIAGQRTLDVSSVRAFAALDDDGWSALSGQVRMVEHARRLATRLPRRALLQHPRLWAALGCEATLRRYLTAAAAARGAQRLVEKTPHHLQWAPHLVRAFPDARLLCITRHPIRTFASYRRRATIEGPSSWAALTPAAFVHQWRGDFRLIARWSDEQRDRFRLIRYEHLVTNPDEEQRRLFGWLGVAPLAELPGKERANPFAPASDAAMLYDEIKPSSSDWRTLLSRHEVAELEKALEPEMAFLGYPPVALQVDPDRQ